MTNDTNTRVSLSTLWIVVMFNMAFADILSFSIPGKIEEIAQFAGDTPIPLLMLAGAVMIEIPLLMIFFSRALPRGLNRWANIFVALLTIAFVVGPEIGNDAVNPHYIFIGTIEVLLLLTIITMAWRWKSN